MLPPPATGIQRRERRPGPNSNDNPLRFPDGDDDPRVLIPVVVGARPEAIKLAPVITALRFGGVIMGCVAAGAPRGRRGYVTGFLIAQIYAFYSWLTWPVLVRSVWRQLTDERGWAKTERERIDTAPAGDPAFTGNSQKTAR